MKRVSSGVLFVSIVSCLVLLSASPNANSPNNDHWPLETLVSKAQNIMIGEVSLVSEKMENMALDGVTSEFLVLTIEFRNVEVVRGNLSKHIVRQSSLYANRWTIGEKVMVFSNTPTELNFDPIPNGGILEIRGEDAVGLIMYENTMLRSIPLQKVRDLIAKATRK